MTHPKLSRGLTKVAILGTFPPRRCGIATFTEDLSAALEKSDPRVRVDAVAMSDKQYSYPDRVKEEVAVDDQIAYALVAQSLNHKGYDVLSVQHEYGIFGGTAGKHLLNFIKSANMPVVTTLHTVLRTPTEEQRLVMNQLLELSARVVVMSQTAIELLAHVHGLDMSKVDYIPHGIPCIPTSAGAEKRREVGGKGPILLTFGLLSPDKGIENVILAMPKLLKEQPGAKYIIVGATHPHVLAHNGESYRNMLVDLAQSLDVSESVKFVNEYVSLDELIQYLSATDFYITPYLNPIQITSGTLAYSLGAGKVVISTPYEYAKEVLAEDRGILVPFRDPEAIANAVISCCEKDGLLSDYGSRAAAYGALMEWDKVGKLYLKSFEQAIEESILQRESVRNISALSLPELEFGHLKELSDDTGILQHATFSTPNRSEGYCVDDNARALILTVQLESQSPLSENFKLLQSRYLSFVVDAFDDNAGCFRNFMSYRRNWLEACGSEDSQGRSLWSLGVVAGHCRTESHSALSAKIFDLAAARGMNSTSPRTWAYSLLGAAAILESGQYSSQAAELMKVCSDKLMQSFRNNYSEMWPWCEERLAYANARIPQALMMAGHIRQRPDMIQMGLETLDWLMYHQMAKSGCFSPVGAQGAGPEDFGTVQFDQQPIEAWSSVSACLTAYKVSGSAKYMEYANWCFDWFLGGNVQNRPMVSSSQGSCFDGLLPDDVNRNQGAESTLAYLSSLSELRQVQTAGMANVIKRELL